MGIGNRMVQNRRYMGASTVSRSVVLLRAGQRVADGISRLLGGTITGALAGRSTNGTFTEVKPDIERGLIGYALELAALN